MSYMQQHVRFHQRDMQQTIQVYSYDLSVAEGEIRKRQDKSRRRAFLRNSQQHRETARCI